MSRPVTNSRYPSWLPRNWRVMTAMGVTTVGLACGLSQPALAEWWKITKAEKPAPAKAATVENGFSGTIRRLLAESRRAEEQGDHAKAVQLAERAAKISDAASQVVGPAGECSPQETARYLADLRTGKSGPAGGPPGVGVASSTPPSRPSPQRAMVPSAQRPAAPGAAAKQPAQVAAAKPQSKSPSRAAAPAVAQKQPPAARVPDAEVASDELPLFGWDPRRQSTSAESVASTKQPVRQAAGRAQPQRDDAIPPSPSDAASNFNELLAQSRLAAADGDMNRAISLADQAVELSHGPSLFGPVSKTAAQNEAMQWQNRLAQLQNVPAVDDEFEPPVKVARQEPPKARTIAASPIEEAAPTGTSLDEFEAAEKAFEVSAASSDFPPAPAPAEAPAVAEVSEPPQPAVTKTTAAKPSNEASESLWTEDLPPAPAPQNLTPRDPVRFSRSVISRSSGWVDADEFEETERENTRAAVAPSSPSSESAPAAETEAADESVPEFPMQEPSPGVAADFAEPAEAPSTSVITLSIDDSADKQPATQPSAEPRRPLKLRGSIQQASAQQPADEATATVTLVSDKSASEPALPSAAEAKPNEAVATDDEFVLPSQPASNEIPVQRFPVQRVMELRQRLESASSLNPGTTKAIEAARKTTQGNSNNGQDSASWESTLETKAKPGDASTPAIKRGPVKLKERKRLQLDDSLEASTRNSTAVPKTPTETRSKVIGRSEMSKWKSADAPEVRIEKSTQIAANGAKANAEQPPLAAPVSQAGYQSVDANGRSDIAVILDGVKKEAKGAKPEQIAPLPPTTSKEEPWYQDDSRRKRKASSTVVVHKNSFSTIDKLAETFKVSTSTLTSIITAGGVVLVAFGLLAVRGAMRRRHSA